MTVFHFYRKGNAPLTKLAPQNHQSGTSASAIPDMQLIEVNAPLYLIAVRTNGDVDIRHD